MFRNPILGWATIATCAVPPAELAIVSTRILVVCCSGHCEQPIGKPGIPGEGGEHL